VDLYKSIGRTKWYVREKWPRKKYFLARKALEMMWEHTKFVIMGTVS
jgi:hypothetical protein